MTSIVVTHDMHTARKVADRVVMLYPLSRLEADEPQIIFDGPPEELDRVARSAGLAVRARRGGRAADGAEATLEFTEFEEVLGGARFEGNAASGVAWPRDHEFGSCVRAVESCGE